MKALKTDPITEADLNAYLAESDDFAFETQAFRMINARHHPCLHGGTYADPVTGKSRQFDIRAEVRGRDESRSHDMMFRLAIECKNIGEHFPLLVQCLPREIEDSFNEFAAIHGSKMKILRAERRASAYKPGEPTGKSLSQVGRDTSNGIAATDSDIYEKWAQSLASAHGLAATQSNLEWHFRAVVPVLVVPNGRLWRACYDDAGKLVEGPNQVDSVQYFVAENYQWQCLSGNRHAFTISHLEIVTLAGLEQLIDQMQGPRGTDHFFNEDLIDDLFRPK
jgi:hypothetical protein